MEGEEKPSGRKRTGRKYMMAPPPPLPLVPVFFLVVLSVICIFQAIVTKYPFVWGIPAGGFLFAVGYLVIRSMKPVKRYR